MAALRIQSSICNLLFAILSLICLNSSNAQEEEKAQIEEAFASVLQASPLPRDLEHGIDQHEANRLWADVVAPRSRIFELLMKSKNKAECAKQIVDHWKSLESDFDQFKIFSSLSWEFHSPVDLTVIWSYDPSFLEASDALNRQLVSEYARQTDFSKKLLRMTTWLETDYRYGTVLSQIKAIRKALEERGVTDWQANRVLMEMASLLGEQDRVLRASSNLDSFDWQRFAIILEAEVYKQPRGFGFDDKHVRLRPIWPLQDRKFVELDTPYEDWPGNLTAPTPSVFSQIGSETYRDAVIAPSRIEPVSKEQAIAAAALQEIGFENWGQKRGKVLTMLIRQEKRDALEVHLEVDDEGRVTID